MKTKIYKILGLALTLVLLASLTVGLAAAPAGANPGTLKWTKLSLPKVEEWTPSGDWAGFVETEGDYWATPDIDLGPIAQTPDGDILFAAVADDGYDTWFDVLKSTDGGYSWVPIGFYEAWLDNGDATPIVAILTSPDYTEDTTVLVATELTVYQSVDGGKNFVCMEDTPPWDTNGGGTITSMDVSLDDRGRLAYMVGTTGGDFSATDPGSDVWVFSTETGLQWQPQFIDVAFGTTSQIDYNVLACAFSPFFADDEGITAVVTYSFDVLSVPAVPGESVGSTDGSGDLAGTLANFPVVAGSVTMDDTTNAYTDDGAGNLTGAPAGTGTIDYTDGDFTIAGGELSAAVTAGYDYYDYSGTTNAMTKMRFSIANTDTGGGWGTDIQDATFVNANLVPFGSASACIGFPEDFDFFGVGNNICFVGIYGADPLDEGGDVYQMLLKESGTSKAVDLNIRGVLTTLAPTATDIVSIDVCGPADGASILVGLDEGNLGAAPETFLVFHSEDSGDSWAPAGKPPTGGNPIGTPVASLDFEGAWTQVLMAPDYCTSGMAYASTQDDGGATSAFSRTTDGGNSWNQISLIDLGDDTYMIPGFTGLDATGYNAAGTIRTVMQVGGLGSVFETQNAGKNWERIFSYGNPGVTTAIGQIVVHDADTFFAVDDTAGYIWRSSDTGATWPKKITTKDDLTTVTFVSPTTLYTGHADGSIWWSTKSGTGWTKPDDSEVPDTPIKILSVMGDVVLVSTGDGMVFASGDGGETVERVGINNPGAAGADGDAALATPDFSFASNNLIYCAVIIGGEDNVADGPDGGIWRTELDLSDPGSSLWVRIDNCQDLTPYDYTGVIAGSPVVCLPPSGVAYVVNQEVVINPDADLEGGLWRSTSATADVDGVHPPYWEKENKNLDVDASLAWLSADVFPTTIFAWNANDGLPTGMGGTGNYWDQVVMFTDTLDTGVTLAMPAADETGVGLLPEGYVYPEVTIAWEEMAGATGYQYQMAIDPAFKTLIPPGCGFTSSLAVGSIELNPNTTYYWRVRVAAESSLIGAPLISPWSETWKFKTAIGASMARPALQAPWPGEPDVSLSPTFEWSGIEWADVYEYELALDPTTTAGGYFTEPLVALVGTDSLVSTAWKCDITLDYETRYYWHVKAIGVDTDTPWSDVGTFTTMGVPAEAPTAQPPITIPPTQEITPAWIWAVVIIGAILVIAVIVLIVTTRRVP
jgi:photosystem II stability/assembly factor-like uncharacterized protein